MRTIVLGWKYGVAEGKLRGQTAFYIFPFADLSLASQGTAARNAEKLV